LQTARALTFSEANGRVSIYLAALSSALVALALIGQTSRLGVAFCAFALILLPVLAFVRLVTFLRLVQSSVEEMAYARRIGLLRTYYLRIAPELEQYFVVDRPTRAAMAPVDAGPSAWQLTRTAPGTVAVGPAPLANALSTTSVRAPRPRRAPSACAAHRGGFAQRSVRGG
jgi:hypothetical protein